MNFSQFCKIIYCHCPRITSQGWFVGLLFSSAGSSRFSKSSNNVDEYQRKLFNGSKPITPKLKDTFPKPISIEGLCNFFKTDISDEGIRLIMTAFGIPITESQNKDVLSKALALQFQRIIVSSNNEVEDVVWLEYQRLLTCDEDDIDILLPLYPGDKLWVINNIPKKNYTVGFYERFEHTWIIKNKGTVTWKNRKLECVNHMETKIRADEQQISIPETLPGDEFKLSIWFDSRGFEGIHESLWQVIDNEGHNCFPDKNMTIKISVDVKNEIHL